MQIIPRHCLERLPKQEACRRHERRTTVTPGALGRLAATIFVGLLIPLIAHAAALADDQVSRPNIVLIMTDNHGAWSLGCYGNPDIRTPKIDRLAAEGTRFTRCYSNYAVCSPTRVSFLTGLMPCQHGVHCYLGAGGAQIGPDAYNTLEEFENVRAIRTNRWKYIERFRQTPNELYDLQSDPGELHNLVDDANHAQIRDELAQRMHDHFARIAEPRWDLWKGGTSKSGLIMRALFDHPGPTKP